MSRHNANVASWVERGIVDSSEVINLRDANINVAFGVEGVFDEELKDNKDYVRVITWLGYHKKDGSWGDIIVPNRRCTDDDFAKFAPVNPMNEKLLSKYKEGSRHLICADWDNFEHEPEIWGNPVNADNF